MAPGPQNLKQRHDVKVNSNKMLVQRTKRTVYDFPFPSSIFAPENTLSLNVERRGNVW
jgi:hypothetical protein